MKKLLKITILVTVFACIFALCASASTIYKYNGEEIFSFEFDENSVISSYEGEFPKYDEQGNALTWYVTSTATQGNDTVKTVEKVLTTDENYFTISNGKYTYKTNTVTNLNVVSACFPDDAGITELNLANGGYRQGSMYTYNPNGSEILFVYLPKTLKVLPERIGQASKILICDIPFEAQIESISKVAFHHSKNLREINIPATVKIVDGKSANDGAAFYYCVSLERVTFGENSVCETIGALAFHHCESLTYVNIPNSVKTVNSHAFSYTQIVESPFSEGSQCTKIGGRAFSDNTALRTFIVPAGLTSVDILGSSDYGPISDCPNVELVTFGNAIPENQIVLHPSFFGRAGIEEIVFPEGITHIPNRYFISATVTEVRFPNSVKTMDERVFEGATVEKIYFGAGFSHFTSTASGHHSLTNQAKGVKEVYLPASFYASAPSTVYQISYAFAFNGANSENVKFFYTGTKAQLEITVENFLTQKSATDTNFRFLGATQISYDEYMLEPEKYEKGNYVIYGYNTCEAFYNGVHMDDGNACVINCDQCATYGKPEENPEHSFVSSIAYENGYASAGLITRACSNDGCVCNANPETQDAAPIFGGYYYSTRINTSYVGLVLSYNVDIEALDAYNEISGQSLEYGVLAVAKDGISGNPAVDAEAQDGIISAELSASRSPRIDFIIKGSEQLWNTPLEQGSALTVKDLEFYILGFVSDGSLKYFYDTDFNADVDQLKAVTFNEIKALAQA